MKKLRKDGRIQDSSGDPQATLDLGRQLEQKGLVEAALQAYAEGLGRFPGHGPLQLRAGLLLAGLGRFASARPLLEAAAAQASVPGLSLLEALGNAQLQTGHYQAAQRTLTQLLEHRPDHLISQCRLALALQHQGKLSQARAHYTQALNLMPQPDLAAQIHTNLGNICRQLSESEAAEAAYRQALALVPAQPEARFNLSRLRDQAGHYEDVVASLQAFIAAHPGHTEIPRLLVRIGEVLRYNDQRVRALPYFEQALQLEPACLAAYNQLGLLLLEENEPEKASACFEWALNLMPDQPLTRLALGAALQMEGAYEAAEAHFREIIASEPDHLLARLGMAGTARQQGNTRKAEALIDEVLAYRPDQLEALAGKAAVLEKQRRFEEGYALLRPLITAGVYDGPIAEAYAMACLRTKRYAEPLDYLSRVLADPDLHFHVRRGILFHLGDLYDKLGQPELAFGSYQAANALKPQRFDQARHLAQTEALISGFDLDLLARLRAIFPGNPSTRPVFIVGMPRSGTTLTEQILASHPQVFGGGELSRLAQIFTDLAGETPVEAAALREHLLNLPAEAYAQAAEAYLGYLDEIGGAGFARVTDKMPANFRFLGLIRLLFPQATIIHCQRDPLDTCFSCFSKDFKHLEFTNSLENLGLYYQQYQRLMAHWDTVVPGGMSVVYEEMIAAQEAVSRRLVAHVGLDWDPLCLMFYQNERQVRTASYEQVRNPIYTHSVARHLPYAPFLKPLEKWISL